MLTVENIPINSRMVQGLPVDCLRRATVKKHGVFGWVVHLLDSVVVHLLGGKILVVVVAATTVVAVVVVVLALLWVVILYTSQEQEKALEMEVKSSCQKDLRAEGVEQMDVHSCQYDKAWCGDI